MSTTLLHLLERYIPLTPQARISLLLFGFTIIFRMREPSPSVKLNEKPVACQFAPPSRAFCKRQVRSVYFFSCIKQSQNQCTPEIPNEIYMVLSGSFGSKHNITDTKYLKLVVVVSAQSVICGLPNAALRYTNVINIWICWMKRNTIHSAIPFSMYPVKLFGT